MSPPAFRFYGKRVFLTYPRCDLSRESIRDHLLHKTGVQHYLVARESHSDGGYHLHAYGEWNSRFSSTDVRVFDVEGHHPNIQPVRSTKRVLEYISKADSETLGNVEQLPGGRVHYGSILDDAKDRDDFLARVRERYSRDYVINHSRLREFCEVQYPTPREQYVPKWTTFDEPDELVRWREQSLGTEVGKYAVPGGPQPPPSSL